MYVAILDDDEAHNELVASTLRGAGHRCATFTRPAAFLAELRRTTFDLLVVDWSMPGLSGVEVIQNLRAFVTTPMPVLMITSRSSEPEIVQGLTAGADDYVIKPTTPSVLLARVNALLRRSYPNANAEPVQEFGPYRFDQGAETVRRNGEVEALTSKEFQLALLFFRNMSRPLSREYLSQHVWGRRADIETRTLDAHVSRVRQKLALRPDNGFRLVTVYGFGYRLEPCEPQATDVA